MRPRATAASGRQWLMCGEDQATPVARPRKRRAWRRLLAETRAEILRHAGYLVRATR